MNAPGRKRGLGRGLDALLGDRPPADAGAGTDATQVTMAAVDEIYRSPLQPRRVVADEGIEELAASIRSQGLLQPCVVRPRMAGGFELIAGERRWRAAQRAGLERIPVVVRDVDDRGALAMALIENVQREDLNPIEEARGLQRLREEFELTQEEVAAVVGKSRPAVANLLRLLNLPDAVGEMLAAGGLEMGHARALLGLPAGRPGTDGTGGGAGSPVRAPDRSARAAGGPNERIPGPRPSIPISAGSRYGFRNGSERESPSPGARKAPARSSSPMAASTNSTGS